MNLIVFSKALNFSRYVLNYHKFLFVRWPWEHPMLKIHWIKSQSSCKIFFSHRKLTCTNCLILKINIMKIIMDKVVHASLLNNLVTHSIPTMSIYFMSSKLHLKFYPMLQFYWKAWNAWWKREFCSITAKESATTNPKLRLATCLQQNLSLAHRPQLLWNRTVYLTRKKNVTIFTIAWCRATF